MIAGSQIIDRRQIAFEQPKIQQCRRAFTPNTNPFAADQLLQDNGIVRRNSDIDQPPIFEKSVELMPVINGEGNGIDTEQFQAGNIERQIEDRKSTRMNSSH